MFSNPPLNLFDPSTFAELNVLMDDIEKDADLKVVVFESGDEDFFMNHHDVENRTTVPDQPGAMPFFGNWPRFVTRLAQSSVISIAKVRGRARAQGDAQRRLLAVDDLQNGRGGCLRLAHHVGAKRLAMVCSDVEALLYLIEAGRGVACLPDFAVKDAIASGRLELLLDSHLTGGNTFHIVWPSSRQMAPKVRVFVDFMVEHFAGGLVTKKVH